jgi:hypothetical protein
MEKSTKKKWLWGIGIFLVLAAIGSMQEKKESSESTIPQQKERVAEQPQETKADRQQREKKEKAVETKKEEVAESKKEDSFLGVYEVTDKVGCTIRITINDDETATVTGVRGENITYYCSWQDFISSGGGIMLKFSDEMPLLIFEGGQDEKNAIFKRFFLKDGWLYSEYNNAKSKNPKWRLKATKIN